MVLSNQDSACDFVMSWTRKKYGCWFQKIDYQKGRHFHIKPSDSSKPSFYLVYKREWLKNFSWFFPEFLNQNPSLTGGLGESLNMEALLRCIRLNIDYVCFIHPDSEIYVIHPAVFLKFARKYDLVREQKRTNFYKMGDGSSNIKSVNETTFCIPKELLTKMEKGGGSIKGDTL